MNLDEFLRAFWYGQIDLDTGKFKWDEERIKKDKEKKKKRRGEALKIDAGPGGLQALGMPAYDPRVLRGMPFDAGSEGMDVLGMPQRPPAAAYDPELASAQRALDSGLGMSRPQAKQPPWEAFLALNPNLDLDKVARQAGGKPGSFPVVNEWGGAISDMSNVQLPKGQTNEEFMQWVKDFTYEQELARKQDPRSRAFDPEGAQRMIDEKVGLKKAAAEDLLARARMLEAENAPGIAALYAAAQGGRQQPSISVSGLDKLLVDLYDQELDDNKRTALLDARVSLQLGDIETVLNTIAQYNKTRTPGETDPDSQEIMATRPKGATELAEKERRKRSRWMTREDGTEVFTGG